MVVLQTVRIDRRKLESAVRSVVESLEGRQLMAADPFANENTVQGLPFVLEFDGSSTTGDGFISYGYGTSPDYSTADIWIGDEIPLRPEETGWQDTVEVDPGTMVSLVATFDLEGEYVWHCHILSHEDNEMMRPYVVV